MPVPACEFEHLGDKFDPSTPVPADHPMVALRPDLFLPDKPRRSPATPKE